MVDLTAFDFEANQLKIQVNIYNSYIVMHVKAYQITEVFLKLESLGVKEDQQDLQDPNLCHLIDSILYSSDTSFSEHRQNSDYRSLYVNHQVIIKVMIPR